MFPYEVGTPTGNPGSATDTVICVVQIRHFLNFIIFPIPVLNSFENKNLFLILVILVFGRTIELCGVQILQSE